MQDPDRFSVLDPKEKTALLRRDGMDRYRMILADNPCRNCEARTEDCHGRCGTYAGWKKEVDEAREIFHRKKHEEHELDHYTIYARRRSGRKIGR